MEWKLTLLVGGSLVFAAGCLVPNRWLPAKMPNDKLMHFVAFAVLGLLALGQAHGYRQAAAWLAGLALTGAAIECLQQLVPDRGFSWRDIAANTAGVAFAGVAAQLYMMI
jgi:VanZ family protein